MFRWLSIGFVVLAYVSNLSAGVPMIPEPVSFTKPVPNSPFVLAILGNPEFEAKQSSDLVRQFAEHRARYPKSGLYRAENHELIWALGDEVYAPYENCFPVSDGIHFIRIEGEWWKTKDYTGGRQRLSPEVEAKQLNGAAISFFAHGKLLKSYRVRDLITNTETLPHTPEHLLWSTGANLVESTGKFHVLTQDDARISFDYRTGEEISRTQLGLANPMARTVIYIILALTGCVLLLWLLFLWRQRTKRGTVGTTANPAISA